MVHPKKILDFRNFKKKFYYSFQQDFGDGLQKIGKKKIFHQKKFLLKKNLFKSYSSIGAQQINF